MTDTIEPRFTRPGFAGQRAAFYGLTFDKKGRATSTVTHAAMADEINAEDYTDIIVFSHGWNTEWDGAVNLYTGFLDGVAAMADRHAGKLPAGMKPAMIGLSWPSAAFVWPWDRAPRIAGVPGPEEDGEVEPDDLDLLSREMSSEDAQRLKALVEGKDTLTGEEIDHLAELLAPLLGTGPAEAGEDETLSAPDLAAMFKAEEMRADTTSEDDAEDEGGFFSGGTVGGGTAEPEAAGLVSDVFYLRKALRLATVRMMKDRAGIVGRGDVADLATDILAKTTARLHLVGHSYGCKLVLSALVKADTPRPATSALLLQPAINNLAFARDVGDGRSGGFRRALEKTEKPILTTESRDDFALRHVFHLAVRRKKDVGEEPAFAARRGRFSAMGGFGPGGLSDDEVSEVAMPGEGEPYPPSGTKEVLNLEATGKITGHSKVVNDFTFWAMLENLR